MFLGLALLLGLGSGELTAVRVLLPCAAAVVVLAVLWPPKVTAGPGWLAVRSLLRTRRVRTDALVGVWRIGEVSVSLVLRDRFGGRVEFAPDTLVANPLLWHLLDAGVRRSREQGTLRTGTRVLDELGERVDGQAREILRASGLG